VTSAVLFVPLSVTTIVLTGASLVQHLSGLGIGIALHLGIVVHLALRAAVLRRRQA
jgi:hypothetical protein